MKVTDMSSRFREFLRGQKSRRGVLILGHDDCTHNTGYYVSHPKCGALHRGHALDQAALQLHPFDIEHRGVETHLLYKNYLLPWIAGSFM
jgi:hypothetical protein